MLRMLSSIALHGKQFSNDTGKPQGKCCDSVTSVAAGRHVPAPDDGAALHPPCGHPGSDSMAPESARATPR